MTPVLEDMSCNCIFNPDAPDPLFVNPASFDDLMVQFDETV
jgi:hypothetical protein